MAAFKFSEVVVGKVARMRIPALVIGSIILATPLYAQSPLRVPDARIYGIRPTQFPEPAEIDGNPRTIEIVLIEAGGPLVIVNPRRADPDDPSKPCMEEFAMPAPLEAFAFQTIRTINGRTWSVTYGSNVFTRELFYDLRPLQFDECR